MATDEGLLELARMAIRAEAEALMRAADRLDSRLTQSAKLLLAHNGKVIVSGLGKSGHVGHKIVATLCSTGTPAVFLHPSEAVHGDLGVYNPGDPTILISKNGTTAELLRLVPILRDFDSPLIGILGNVTSPLGNQVDIVLDASVENEADPHNLTPTSSTTLAMALGDALAIVLMQARNFTAQDFARYHPGGQLGRNLLMRVREVMHVNTARVSAQDSVKHVVMEMTHYPLGAACVIDEAGCLLGIVTDGDLRRALQKHDDIRGLCARDIMTTNPVMVKADSTLKEALNLMENRPSRISVLPVLDESICVGLLRIHDIYQPDRS